VNSRGFFVPGRRWSAFYRKLRETARGGRIHAAADAEHVSAKPLRDEIVAKESDALFPLHVGVEIVRNAEFANDGLLPGIPLGRKWQGHGEVL
jgi:hypothetical protein